MNDRNAVKKYTQLLQKRVNYVKQKYAQTVWKNLYTNTPIKTGAARASWNISLNVPDYEFNANKTSNTFISLNCKIQDTIIVASGCPYMMRLNYRTFKTSTI